jgi:hypothetical protein
MGWIKTDKRVGTYQNLASSAAHHMALADFSVLMEPVVMPRLQIIVERGQDRPGIYGRFPRLYVAAWNPVFRSFVTLVQP